ncbi:MAG: Ig-like domain-containing protein [Melioribacteraceae bacterium]|nr:Ig-like domain-containing protein [Melioribacteraceae bacterium]
MKKVLLVSVLLIFSFANFFAQDATISIPDLIEVGGTEVLVPVNITTLNTVGAITLEIRFDPAVMSYTGVVENNSITSGFFQANSNGDTLVIVSWFGSPPIDLANGKIFDLKFNYFGGSTSIEFDFVEFSRSNPYQVYNVPFINGSISEGVVAPVKIELNDVNGVPGDTVSVELSGLDLVDIGSMNLYIAYDTTVAKFIGIGTLNLPGFISNAANGIVSLGMFNSLGFNHVFGAMADLEFELLTGNTSLAFQPSSQVGDKDLNPISVEYTDGSITISDSEMYLSDVVERANQNINIPFSARNLTDVGSFNLDIDFDETSLTFVAVHDYTIGGTFTSNVVSGVLKLGYINAAGVTASDILIADIEFSYTGGNSDLTFNKATADVRTTSFAQVAVLFYDGSVTELPNQPPSFVNTLPDTTIAENEYLTYLYTGNDPDNDSLTFALVSGPGGAILDAGGDFAWTPTYDEAGEYEVIVSLTDGMDTVYDTTQITVTESNRNPYFTNTLPDTTIVELETLDYLYTGVDPDDDPLTFSLDSGPVGVEIDSIGNFSWTPTRGQAGIYDLVIAGLSDGQIMVYDTTSITVISANEAPYFTKTMPDTTITEGNLLSFQYAGEDPNDDPLTFVIHSAPTGATISSDGAFAWTPATNEDINATIIVSLTDQVETVFDTAEVSILTDIDDLSPAIPKEFSLSQNYPNPFNPSTIINYSLPESAMVNLTIFDITGQEIVTLLNSEISAGFHEISFDASKLAGGVYLYRIIATNSNGLNFINTKKMLLIK